MKKVYAVILVTGSILNAVCGLLILIINNALQQTVNLGAAVSFLMGILLLCSPVFAVWLLRRKAAGSLMIILSAVLCVVFLFAIQTNGLTVEPVVLIGVCALQIILCILAVLLWITQSRYQSQ